MDEFVHQLKAMATTRPGVDYIAVTLLGSPEEELSWSVTSHWTGFTDGEPRLEIRCASIVHPERMVKLWTDLGQSHLVVHDERELFLFRLCGGNALVAAELAGACHPEWVQPFPVARHGLAGYVSIDMLPETALRRAPTPKERMRVFNRDGRRCRVCGSSPDDNVHIVLHVHHIRPWSHGGVTYADNLITLCHTCHAGLEPHEDLSLFDLLGLGVESLRSNAAEYWEGVRNYQRLMRALLQREREAETTAID